MSVKNKVERTNPSSRACQKRLDWTCHLSSDRYTMKNVWVEDWYITERSWTRENAMSLYLVFILYSIYRFYLSENELSISIKTSIIDWFPSTFMKTITAGCVWIWSRIFYGKYIISSYILRIICMYLIGRLFFFARRKNY